MNPKSVAAIILAAGMSQRMGRLKPLLPFGDKPMLARVVENLVAAQEIAPLIVVTGHAASAITAALSGYPVTFAHNENYAMGGMLSSVQVGVRALPSNASAFFLVLGDQPTVRPATLQTLLEVWRETAAPIVLPTHNGRRGHPVLFSSRCASEILALPTDATLKACVMRHVAETIQVPVPDESILADVDTPADYERALRIWQAQNA